VLKYKCLCQTGVSVNMETISVYGDYRILGNNCV